MPAWVSFDRDWIHETGVIEYEYQNIGGGGDAFDPAYASSGAALSDVGVGTNNLVTILGGSDEYAYVRHQPGMAYPGLGSATYIEFEIVSGDTSTLKFNIAGNTSGNGSSDVNGDLSSFTAGDVVGVVYDGGSGISVFKNGTFDTSYSSGYIPGEFLYIFYGSSGGGIEVEAHVIGSDMDHESVYLTAQPSAVDWATAFP